MAVVADRVIVELEAKLDRYEANVRRAEAKFDSATRSISQNSQKMARDIERNSAAAGESVKRLVGTLAAAFTAAQVKDLADGYTRFTNQLKVAGLEGQNLAATQTRLFDISQKYGVQLESVGTLYGRATAVSKELGASQQQLTQFTTGVAAALKIQGTSASESQGALLQLGQLLGSGRVQAEEFNSVLEGARPILVAVAKNFEGAGGSVSKLKQLVNDGKVSNQAFFQAFLQGSLELEAQATKSSATISQGFTVLTNALSQYIGQTDASLGASERINAALILLADNLDKVSLALGVIGAVLLGRFVAGMVGAAASTGVASTAIFALQARAVGAATTMEALALTSATAGRAMLAAFGGPVGLAVTALTLGIAYFVTTSNDAAEAADNLKASIDAQTQQFTAANSKAAQAAAETNNLSNEQRAALTSTANLTGEVNLLATAWGRVAAQAKTAAIEQARAAFSKSTQNLVEAGNAYNAKRESGFRAAARRPFAERGLGANAPALNPQEALAAGDRAAAAERAQFLQAARNRKAARAELERIEGQKLVEFKPPAPVAPPGSGKTAKPKKAAAGPKAADPDKIAARFADDLANAEVALAQAQADVVGTLEARAAAERTRIENDRVAEAAKIKAEKSYTDAQREQLLVLNERIANERKAAVDAELRRQAAQDAVDIATSDITNQRDLLEAQRALTTSTGQRRDIALRLLDLQQQEEKLRLEAIIASEAATNAEKEIAKRRLAILGTLYGAQQQDIEQQYEGPLKANARRLNRSPEDLQRDAEQIVVDELQHVQDGITSAITNKLGTKDPLISGLINLFIEQVVMKPLADAFAKGSAGAGGLFGSILSGLGSIFTGGKRASGGHVNAGRIYQVNDGGGTEGFQPAGSGKIIPLGQMNRAGGSGGTSVYQTFTLDARYGITTPELLRHVNAVATNKASQAGAASFDASQKATPSRLERFNKLGT